MAKGSSKRKSVVKKRASATKRTPTKKAAAKPRKAAKAAKPAKAAKAKPKAKPAKAAKPKRTVKAAKPKPAKATPRPTARPGDEWTKVSSIAGAAGHALVRHPGAAVLASICQDADDARALASSPDERAFASAPEVASLTNLLNEAMELSDIGPKLHFALTGQLLHEGDGVVARALRGARQLAGTPDKHPVGLLLPDEVREVADHLAALGDPFTMFDATRAAELGVHPAPGNDESARRMFDAYFAQLRELYRNAADRGDAILVRFQAF